MITTCYRSELKTLGYWLIHNIIQIHSSVLWDWQYFEEYSSHSVSPNINYAQKPPRTLASYLHPWGHVGKIWHGRQLLLHLVQSLQLRCFWHLLLLQKFMDIIIVLPESTERLKSRGQKLVTLLIKSSSCLVRLSLPSSGSNSSVFSSYVTNVM